MRELADLVRGKTVAVVGNALSLVNKSAPDGSLSDACDHVLRMNAGVPGVLDPMMVGNRTTIWATAKHFGSLDPKPELMVFMKLTELGDRHWLKFQSEFAKRPYPMIRWPQSLEDEVRKYVGADPGTGIRMLYYLKNYTEAASIGAFGFDCWHTPSSWSGRPNTPNHKPHLEIEAMYRLFSE